MTVVDTGVCVTLHFALELEDGHVVDSNFAAQPVSFTLGDGNLLPSFEAVLVGMGAGDERQFVLSPEQAFGPYNSENVQAIARNSFDEDDLAPGVVYSFQNGDGELPGVIIDVSDKRVMIDFNHPLAGQNIIFRVKIISVSPEQVH